MRAQAIIMFAFVVIVAAGIIAAVVLWVNAAARVATFL